MTTVVPWNVTPKTAGEIGVVFRSTRETVGKHTSDGGLGKLERNPRNAAENTSCVPFHPRKPFLLLTVRPNTTGIRAISGPFPSGTERNPENTARNLGYVPPDTRTAACGQCAAKVPRVAHQPRLL